MAEPLLTIVTVTKNCAKTIDSTLDSVASVKRADVEYVVVDGVSSDGTLDAIRSRGSLVDRLVSEPDSGIYHAMNKAVGLAQGRFVLFINGDDALIPDGFPVVMDALECLKESIVCATTLVGDVASPDEILVAKPWRLPFFNSIPHPSTFVRRSLLLQRPFREDLRIVSDYDFFLASFLTGLSFRVLPVVTALHHRGGASGDVAASSAEVERVRQERLGWRYTFFHIVSLFYYRYKSLISARHV